MKQVEILHKENSIVLPELLEEHLELLEKGFNGLAYLLDSEQFKTLPDLLADPQAKRQYLTKLDLLIDVISNSDDVEKLEKDLNDRYTLVDKAYDENMKMIKSMIQPFERTARALELTYRNAGGEADIWILPVDATKFAGTANPQHFNIMKDDLEKRFYSWRVEESPFYIGYIGEMKNKSAIDEMGLLGEETKATAVLDLKELGTAKAVTSYATSLKFAGVSPHLAHVVVAGTWVYPIDAYEDYEETIKMAVPAAGSIIGKMLKARLGQYITGLEQEAILGIDGVRVSYDRETIDSYNFEQCGMVQIEPYGHIMGTTTANNSNNPDLRDFPKIEVCNAIEKSLAKFSNAKCMSKWGRKQADDLRDELLIYFNKLVLDDVIQDPCPMPKISYTQDDKTVNIDIVLDYFETASVFSINISGQRNRLNMTKKPA